MDYYKWPAKADNIVANLLTYNGKETIHYFDTDKLNLSNLDGPSVAIPTIGQVWCFKGDTYDLNNLKDNFNCTSPSPKSARLLNINDLVQQLEDATFGCKDAIHRVFGAECIGKSTQDIPSCIVDDNAVKTHCGAKKTEYANTIKNAYDKIKGRIEPWLNTGQAQKRSDKNNFKINRQNRILYNEKLRLRKI